MKELITGFITKFYEAVIIFLAAFLLLALIGFCVQTWRVKHLKTSLENTELKCEAEKDKIRADHKGQAEKEAEAYRKALAEHQSTINQLSSVYETEKAKYKVKVETKIKYINKVVERPVYLNECNDDDGLSAFNEIIKSRSAK